MNWQALARAVVSRRVELGMKTRGALAEATGLSARTLGDIERARRTSLSPSTLAKVEQVLGWPEGHIDALLHTAPDDDPLAILGSLLEEGPDGTPRLPPDLKPEHFPEGSPQRRVLTAFFAGLQQQKVVTMRPVPGGTEVGKVGGPKLRVVRPDAAEPSDLQTPEGIARHVHRDDLPLVALLHRAGLDDTILFRIILKVRAIRERQSAQLLTEVADLIRAAGGWAPEQPYPPLWLLDDDAGAP